MSSGYVLLNRNRTSGAYFLKDYFDFARRIDVVIIDICGRDVFRHLGWAVRRFPFAGLPDYRIKGILQKGRLWQFGILAP